MSRQELIDQCERLFKGGDNFEAVIAFLRQSGCSKMESIAVIASCSNVGLGKAKEVVHLSTVWNDTRILDDEFHQSVANALSDAKTD